MIPSFVNRLKGDAYTIGPKAARWLRPTAPPPSVGWSRRIDGEGDPGPVYMRGRHSRVPGSETLIALVHGLGGCADSDYCVDAARAFHEAGYATLRISMRGAERDGDDIYHGALNDDLRAIFEAPSFRGYDEIVLVGFSLGGHLSLRAAVDFDYDRLERVVAISSPLDLEAAQQSIDRPARYPYRRYVLRELRSLYRAVATRGRAPTPLDRVDRVETLREWDAVTVVPRFGFGDVETYYRRASVAQSLDRLERSALLISSRLDPMVPPSAIEPGLEVASDALQMEWTSRGGHVYFASDVDLGLGPEPGLVPQIRGWLERS